MSALKYACSLANNYQHDWYTNQKEESDQVILDDIYARGEEIESTRQRIASFAISFVGVRELR